MDNLREGGQENQVRGTGSLPSRFAAASTKKRHIISVLYVLFFLVFLLLLCLLDLNDYFTLAVCLFLGAMFVLDAVKYDFGKTISVEEDKLTVGGAVFERENIGYIVDIGRSKYVILTKSGKLICRVMNSYDNFDLLWRWLVRGGCHFVSGEESWENVRDLFGMRIRYKR